MLPQSQNNRELPPITLSVQIQVEAKSIFVFGAAGHVIRIFQDMNVTSPEYLSGHSTSELAAIWASRLLRVVKASHGFSTLPSSKMEAKTDVNIPGILKDIHL